MKYRVTMNGRTYEVQVEAGKAMLLGEYNAIAPAVPGVAAAEAAPACAAAPVITGAGSRVDAPMPGTIVKVNVSAGQAVQAGQVLIVLEAMKMENEILAPKAGTIAQVLVSSGSNVDTGTPLVVLA